MDTFPPFNEIVRFPLPAHPALAAWKARLRAIPGWTDPFAGHDVPTLPPVP